MAGVRGRSGWVLLCLILSHETRISLQCMPTSSQPKNRKPVFVNVERTVDYDLESPSNAVVPVEEWESREDQDIFKRTGGNRESSLEDGPIQLCKNRLIAILMKICRGQFHVPTVSRIDQQSRKRSLQTSSRSPRLPRYVVDECCKKQCTEKFLQSTYCQAESQSQTSNQVSNSESFILNSEPEEPTLAPQLPEPEPDSAYYYPLFHLLKLIFQDRLNTKQINDVQNDAKNEVIGTEKPLPLPQARFHVPTDEFPLEGPSPPQYHHRQPSAHNFFKSVEPPAGININGGASFTAPNSYRFRNSQSEQRMPEGTANAVIAPQPPFMFHLGMNTNDDNMQNIPTAKD